MWARCQRSSADTSTSWSPNGVRLQFLTLWTPSPGLSPSLQLGTLRTATQGLSLVCGPALLVTPPCSPKSQASLSPLGSELGPRCPHLVSGLRGGKGPQGQPPPVAPALSPLQCQNFISSASQNLQAVPSEVALFALAPQPASPARSR